MFKTPERASAPGFCTLTFRFVEVNPDPIYEPLPDTGVFCHKEKPYSGFHRIWDRRNLHELAKWRQNSLESLPFQEGETEEHLPCS